MGKSQTLLWDTLAQPLQKSQCPLLLEPGMEITSDPADSPEETMGSAQASLRPES